MKDDYKQNYKYINQLSQEDKHILESLVNSYGNTAINETVSIIAENQLNEVGYSVSVANPGWSDNKTRGARDVDDKKRLTGLSGAIKALPSAAISFLICPPMALLQLIGAVRQRMEKKWLSRLVNTKTWMDYIANPRHAKDKMRDAFAVKTQYYYTTLANGEVLKVPAVNTLEAKDMVLAISDKQNKAYYEHMCKYTNMKDSSSNSDFISSDLKYTSTDEKCKMWVVLFDDGQAAYAFGPDLKKDDIKKEAEESKKAVIDYYKKIKLRGGKDKKGDHVLSDYEKDKILKHRGIGKKDRYNDEEIDLNFVYPKVDDMVEIGNTGMYEMITDSNIHNFDVPTTSPKQWRPRGFQEHIIPIGETDKTKLPMHQFTNKQYIPIELNISAPDKDSAGNVAYSIIHRKEFADIVRREHNTIKDNITCVKYGTNSGNSQSFYCPKVAVEITAGNDSKFRLTCYYDLDANGSVVQQVNTSNKNDYLFYSDINSIVKTISDAVVNGYIDSKIDKKMFRDNISYNLKTGNTYTLLDDKKQIQLIPITNKTAPPCQLADWSSVENDIQQGNIEKDGQIKSPGGTIRPEVVKYELKLAM